MALGNFWTSCSKWTSKLLFSCSSLKITCRPSTRFRPSNSVGRKCSSKIRKSFWAVFRISVTPFNCCPTLGSWRTWSWLATPDKIMLAANNSWLTVSWRSRAIRLRSLSTISSSFCMTRFSVRCKFSVRRLSFRSKRWNSSLISLFSPSFSFLPSSKLLKFFWTVFIIVNWINLINKIIKIVRATVNPKPINRNARSFDKSSNR